MNIKKTHSRNGKKYSVIIKAEKNIVEDKQYPAIFKEVKMSNKAPAWFVEFEKKNDARWNRQEQFNKEVISRLDQVDSRLDQVDSRLDQVDSRLDNLEKDMKQVKQDIVLIKNCPTIKTELQQSN